MNHTPVRSKSRRGAPVREAGEPREARGLRELRLTPLMLSLLCVGMAPALAQQLPTGFAAIAGDVTQSQAGAVMTINQGSARAIAQWQTFSIGAGGTVNVAQPSGGMLLNRVVGNELSTIAGTLNAPSGHVFLVNPNGVLFSKGSSVSVGGLVASTLDISNASFMAGGKQLQFERADGVTAAVVNQGSITASPGGLVALMGAQAINEGSINVARGTAALVSARTVTVDFDGDGLTRFTIPADSKATAALVSNAGSISADGGRIALAAASTAKAQVVNQSGVLRARALESRDGQIVLSAGIGTGEDNLNSMSVSGTLDVSGGGAGNGGRVDASAGRMALAGAAIDASGVNGGQVSTSAHYLTVDAATSVNASGSGQPQTSDGRWTVNSGQDITISSNPPYFVSNSVTTAPMDGGSIINPAALRSALNNSTSLTLNTDAIPTNFDAIDGYSAGLGVRFDTGADVAKTAGRAVDVTINSARNIIMGSGSALGSTSGALAVNFNADAAGDPLPDVLPMSLNADGRLGGYIEMQGARIESNGGDIRFFGQSRPGEGRATGGAQNRTGFAEQGVRLQDSLVTTCASGQEACGGGSIDMRGQGGTGTQEGNEVTGGVGVAIYSSQLRTGSGDIVLDGRGGLGASGVRSEFSPNGEGGSSIASAAGNIRITGSTRNWAAGDPAVVFNSEDGTGAADFFGGGGGVSLINTRVSAGGGITLDGTGGDFSLLANNAEFLRLLIGTASSNSATVGGSSGVLLNNTGVSAGAGQQISVTGKSGSNGFRATVTPANAIVVTPDADVAGGVVVAAQGGFGTLQAPGGRISLVGREGSDVYVSFSDDSEGSPVSMLNVASATGQGGSIDIAGRNILITNDFPSEPSPDFISADGVTGGGSISVRGTGAISIDQYAGMAASAVGSTGNGGTIHVVAGGDLRSFGTYAARGGSQGGNGGFVETSGRLTDLTGARVDASALAGTAGTWLIDPANITVVDGAATGSLPTAFFEPLANATVQDADINLALNTGTSVTIVAHSSGPTAFDGNIQMNSGTSIVVDKAGTPVTFSLQADRAISAFGANIQSTSAPLNVQFNAGLDGGGGSIFYNGQILTNGGNVTMSAPGSSNSAFGIGLGNTLIDTRGAAADGSVNLTVPAPGASVGGFTTAAISLDNTDIAAGRGDVTLSAYAQTGTGVRLDGTLFIGEGRLGEISTTTGDISITGVGAFSSNSSEPPGHGVVIGNARLTSLDGNITVRGLRQAGGTPGTGVSIVNGAQLITTGTGDIEVTGESQGGGTGLLLAGATTEVQGVAYPAAFIDGNRHVVLRASNDGSTDAIALNGTVRAGQVLNLRPGGVDAATGAGANRTGDPITLLGTGAGGFAISADEMARLSAATVVVGGSTHAADISVLAPMASAVPLTLQNGGGGSINLTAPVSAPQLGLISGGNITQAAGASITAGTLLAQSFGGDVILSDAGNNVSANTLGGGAAGRFEFVNSGPLRVGPVSVTAFDSAGNLPQVQAASSMAANTVLVRTLAGELILDAPVSSTNGADLVAATTFQNAGGGSLSGAPWRVWADTWVGETRGGLVGSGPLPNLYHCAYLGLCTVTVSPGDNHFIYAQQPSLTVTLGSFARNVGEANPLFTYLLSGLILGDTGVGVSGSTSTPAGLQSPAGRYPIFGTFSSAEGYAVNVVPGELLINGVLPQPARFVDVLREEPTTYLYDRNIGQAPICLATGPLEGDRAQQGNDMLAREWSRVRTRPNLVSCLDVERSNGCADF